MRWYSISIALAIPLAVAACKEATPEQAAGGSGGKGSASPTEARPVPKKPVDTKPLPALAKDPGGATGKPLRAVGFGGLGIDAGRDIALAANGDAYVVGYFDGEGDFGPAGKFKAAGDQTVKKNQPTDGFVVKLGADGKIAWARTFGGDHDDTANAVAVRGDKIAVVGAFSDELKLGEFSKKAMGSDDLFVASFDPTGGVRWVWHAGGLDSDGANAVAATPDGGWVVGGSYTSTATFRTVELKSKGGTDAFLLKLDAAGDLEWVKSFGGRYPDRIKHVGVDGQGNIYVQGEFRDTADWGGPKPLIAAGGADFDIALAKYDLNGDHKWSKRFGSQFDEHAGGLAVDPAGNVTITGAFRKTISFGDGDDHTSLGEDDIYIAHFDTTGKLAWAHTYGADRDDSGSGVASDAAGNTILTGWFQNAVDFGLGPVRSKNFNKDVFVVKLDPRGALTWLQTWGDKDHDQGRALAIDDKGAAHVLGLFRFQLSVVDPPVESAHAPNDRAPKVDTFVVKLDR
jgi:hypothetical protein